MKMYLKWILDDDELVCVNRDNKAELYGAFDLSRLFPKFMDYNEAQQGIIETGIKAKLNWTLLKSHNLSELKGIMHNRFETMCNCNRASQLKRIREKLSTSTLTDHALDNLEALLNGDKS